MKARHPSIPWKQMAGAGNVYRHDYEDVAAGYVWQTLKHDLPQLRLVVEPKLHDRERPDFGVAPSCRTCPSHPRCRESR
jgi:uncharacterized protein with HEPN domain